MMKIFKPLLALALVWATGSASAGLISATFEGSDCAGYFGTTFDACQIFIDDGGQRVEISPVIAKYEMNEDMSVAGVEINSADFGSFDGSEVSISGGTSNTSGTWSYNPGANDPGIRYWSAKGGSSFNLFWYVSAADESSYCSGSTTFTLDCLNAAQTVSGGDWTSPNGKGLSHLTVYDSEPPIIVPEPGTSVLISLGLMGLWASRRRAQR